MSGGSYSLDGGFWSLISVVKSAGVPNPINVPRLILGIRYEPMTAWIPPGTIWFAEAENGPAAWPSEKP